MYKCTVISEVPGTLFYIEISISVAKTECFWDID